MNINIPDHDPIQTKESTEKQETKNPEKKTTRKPNNENTESNEETKKKQKNAEIKQDLDLAYDGIVEYPENAEIKDFPEGKLQDFIMIRRPGEENSWYGALISKTDGSYIVYDNYPKGSKGIATNAISFTIEGQKTTLDQIFEAKYLTGKSAELYDQLPPQELKTLFTTGSLNN